MKTRVNKDLTTLAQAAQVKADLAEFKARYTDGDLMHFYNEATDDPRGYCHRIIESVVEGFPGGSAYNDETQFCVSLIAIDYASVVEIRYYCNMELEIDTRTLPDGTKMFSTTVYKREDIKQ